MLSQDIYQQFQNLEGMLPQEMNFDDVIREHIQDFVSEEKHLSGRKDLSSIKKPQGISDIVQSLLYPQFTSPNYSKMGLD